MKNKLFILLMSLCAVKASGQGGGLDLNFGSAGKLVHFVGANPVKAVLQSDEKIISVGYKVNSVTVDFFAARYRQNGVIDSTFGTYGISVVTPASGNAVSVSCAAVQADDKIVIAGIVPGADYQLALARLNANGSIDPTFNVTGQLSINLPDSFLSANAIKILPDGKILVAGGTGSNTTGNVFPTLVLIKPDGTLDNAFGTNGVSIITDVGFPSFFNDIAIQSDGKIVASLNQISTATPSSFYLMRLYALGVRDNLFGTNGMTTTSFANSAAASSVIIQEDDKIVLAGTETFLPGQLRLSMARYLDNGGPDNTFGAGGKVISSPTYSLGVGSVFTAQQDDGKLVVSASSKSASAQKFDFMLSRFLANGSIDNEFGSSGYVLTDFFQNTDNTNAIFIQNNGMILVGGYSVTVPFQMGFIMSRYNYCGVSVTGQPENLTKKAGANAKFSLVSSLPSSTYQWQIQGASDWENLVDGGQYSGTHTFTLNIANVTLANNFQKYRGVVMSGICADTSDLANLTVEAVDNITEVIAAVGIQVYPNPSNGKLSIDLKDNKHVGLNYFITDLPGRKMVAGKLQAMNNVINIEALSKGIYLLHLEHIGTLKFVRN